jgi:hypothetical protein
MPAWSVREATTTAGRQMDNIANVVAVHSRKVDFTFRPLYAHSKFGFCQIKALVTAIPR